MPRPWLQPPLRPASRMPSESAQRSFPRPSCSSHRYTALPAHVRSCPSRQAAPVHSPPWHRRRSFSFPRWYGCGSSDILPSAGGTGLSDLPALHPSFQGLPSSLSFSSCRRPSLSQIQKPVFLSLLLLLRTVPLLPLPELQRSFWFPLFRLPSSAHPFLLFYSVFSDGFCSGASPPESSDIRCEILSVKYSI